MPLPKFDDLWKNYPHGTSAEVKKKIGGRIDAEWITNTCAIRLSFCFNASGAKFAVGSDAGNSKGVPRLVITGGDKKRYILRVKEFRTWLEKHYGKPTISLKKGPYGDAPPELAGKKGIICFEDCGWPDASGHYDLWDGSAAAHHAYFDKAKRVHLWECKPAFRVAPARAGQTSADGVPIVTLSTRAGP